MTDKLVISKRKRYAPGEPRPRPGRPVGSGNVSTLAALSVISTSEYEAEHGKKLLRPLEQEELRARIDAPKLLRKLQQHADGQCDMTATQVKAAQILLDKSLSNLSSIEMHHISDNDKMSESDIMGKLIDIISRRPDLAARLVGSGKAAAPDPSPQDAYNRAFGPCIVCGGEGLAGGCVACGADPADDPGVSDGAGGPGVSDGAGGPGG